MRILMRATALSGAALMLAGCTSTPEPSTPSSLPEWTSPAAPSDPVAKEQCDAAMAAWIEENRTSTAYGTAAFTQATEVFAEIPVRCEGEVVFSAPNSKRTIKSLRLVLGEDGKTLTSQHLS